MKIFCRCWLQPVRPPGNPMFNGLTTNYVFVCCLLSNSCKNKRLIRILISLLDGISYNLSHLLRKWPCFDPNNPVRMLKQFRQHYGIENSFWFNSGWILYLRTTCYQIVIQLLHKSYFYFLDTISNVIRMNFAEWL